MGIIQDELQKIDGFLVSIVKNPDNDTYVFEIGIPINWQYKSNDFINVNELWSSEEAVCLKLSTDDDQVTIDDFIKFIEAIIDVNILIEEENKKLEVELQKRKAEMEELVQQKILEIEQIKKSSIDSFSKDNPINKKQSTKSEPKNKKEDGINEETDNQ